ncbi:CoA-disulfide reductase [Halanaerobacter jeridensis]|uniref:NADPH-dependent 2,4-dienoyl-CoA reductase/sulfur reductase-like enzyme/peroxiredoxin family protein/TusA-related sulfurtransferase/rhodanese-related sulfurtransferase n=1 Tax=Halanaerobacter jeridensis TaxID=706427 RepID=A0A938XQG5_9FIRM|nr:NADPH-dependent 2,4-dienoyl-CoA reductase/sulfur reductase-like enzyme/peroxiredoxin family protein/TusA-related sulfurtransferase/rhodanese-related sulfurtransferase [Halanaerobacter jeridensis]
MSNKVLIVGGVAGGASTAARLRRMDEDAEIVVFEKGDHISFANCGLPYHIGEVIEDREKLLVQTPEAMEARFDIDVRVKNKVTEIDRENKKIEVRDLDNCETYEEDYDYLVLSPGAEPILPPVPGADGDNIYTLRNIPDTDQIKGFVDNNEPKSAVVVGAGYIGVEMAENLHDRGLDVSIVEMAPQVLGPIDREMAAQVHNHLRMNGINLYLDNAVAGFDDVSGRKKVELQDGTQLTTDLVIMSAGVKPMTELAEEAGLEIGDTGAIKVNHYLQTSDENIYALGDAIEVTNSVTGEAAHIPLAGPANKQGRIVANNITGEPEKFKGSQGTAIAKVFDLAVGATGVNEKQLQDTDIEYDKTYINKKNHAGYYPGAVPMTIKVLFTPEEGKLLGAQVVGYDGVDKRVDVFATAIEFEKTVFDLQELDLAYAPPFGSAKDPVNMAGFVAGNMLNGKVEMVNWDQVDDLKPSTLLLDVREEVEVQLGKIEGAVNIPLNELRDRLDELDKEQEIVVYCAVGLRGYIATRILMQNGFENVKNLAGGYKLYDEVKKDKEEIVDDTTTPEHEKLASITTPEESKYSQDEIERTVKEGEKFELDACGLQCPGPIMQVSQKMQEMEDGDILEVTATDPGFTADIKSWCESTGNTLLDTAKDGTEYSAKLQKGSKEVPAGGTGRVVEEKNGTTMVVFSGDLDKAIASFIIANGAASMGKDVTLFFTFWGLNVLRKNKEDIDVEKSAMDKMFGKMMPQGSENLSLSTMNMFGMGPKMIRKVMENKGVDSLETLIEQAQENGVRLVACQMTMDLLGFSKEELIDGVEVGGVATFLNSADQSNMSLFI